MPNQLPNLPPKGNFVLQVTDSAGNLDSLYYIREYHTGAGRSSLVTTADHSTALNLAYSESDEHISSVPAANSVLFTVVLDTSATDCTPAGYGCVSFNGGSNGSKFTFSKDFELQFDASQKAGTTFAVCPEPIDLGGKLDFLTVRAPGVKRNELCADVVVKAIAV